MEYIVTIISDNKFIQEALESIKVLSNFYFKTFEKFDEVPKSTHLVVTDNMHHTNLPHYPAIINISDKGKFDLKKPFHINDLIKMIQKKIPYSHFDLGDVIFDPLKRKIYAKSNNNLAINLTEKEALILGNLFYSTPNSLSKNKLLQKVWKYNNNTETTTIDTHVYRLRLKLSKITDKNLLISENESYKLNI